MCFQSPSLVYLPQEVWLASPLVGSDDLFPDWWLRRRKQVAQARTKAFDSICTLVARCIWLHRNEVVFRNGDVSVNRAISDRLSFGWVGLEQVLFVGHSC
jgi:hypothetical protein